MPRSTEPESSRSRFISDLPARVIALRNGLQRVQGTTNQDLSELNAVRRRMHALTAAARVLDFGTAADALAQAEAALTAGGSAPPQPMALERVTRILDLLPTLVLGGGIDLSKALDPERLRPLSPPLSVAIHDADLAQAVLRHGGVQGLEVSSLESPDRLLIDVERISPDAIVLDGDNARIRSLLPQLRRSWQLVPIVALCSFEHPDRAGVLVAAGATRILPHPPQLEVLARTLRHVCSVERSHSTPHGAFARLSPRDLVRAIHAEASRALVDSIEPEYRDRPIDFGSGSEVCAALWLALAELRRLASESSEAPRFALAGPSGAIALSPGPGQRPLADSQDIDLTGRRIVCLYATEERGAALRRALQPLGVEILEATETQAALRLCEQHWPAAVVTELSSGDINGLELAQTLEHDIALADVPVLLLTPASTEGALGAQLTPSSVAAYLELALAKRAAFEQRMRSSSATCARVDGITPRTLLELACTCSEDCQIELRSGPLSFEISIRQGRLQAARLLESARVLAAGAGVLGALMGIRTGRVRIIPGADDASSQFEDGDLYSLLEPVFERARKARACLVPERLGQVSGLQLDPNAVSQYLTLCPRPLRSLVNELAAGTSPRALLARAAGASGAGNLHSALGELARHGAVLAVLDDDGRDRLSRSRPTTKPPRKPSSAPAPAATQAGNTPPFPSGASLSPPPAPRFAFHPQPTGMEQGIEPDEDALPLGEAVKQALVLDDPFAEVSASHSSAPPHTSVAGGTASEPPHTSVAPASHAPRKPAPSASSPPEHSEQPDPEHPDPEHPSHAPHDAEQSSFYTLQKRDSFQARPSRSHTHTTAPAPASRDPEVQREESRSRSPLQTPPQPKASSEGPPEKAPSSYSQAVAQDLPLSPHAQAARNAWAEFEDEERSSEDASAAELSAKDSKGDPEQSGKNPLRKLLPLLVVGLATITTFAAVRWVRGQLPFFSVLRTNAAKGSADAGGAVAPLADAGRESMESVEQPLAKSPTAPIAFRSEVLPPPPQVQLRPGEGLLEVRAPKRQRIYIDGVFVGRYENRLVPLQANSYVVRLMDGGATVEHTVQVLEGKRTRLLASSRDED